MKKSVLRPLSILMALILSFSFFEIASPISAYAYGKDKPIIVVSMGDSYSSGEGIEPFYGQVDDKGNDLPRSEKILSDDWVAHRSMYSWPSMLKVGDKAVREHKMPLNKSNDDSEMQWYFVAASGAVTNHFDNPYPHTIKTLTLNWRDKSFIDDSRDLPRQFEVFEDNHLTGEVDYVTMSIGGNDLGFVNLCSTAAADSWSWINPGTTFQNPNLLNNLVVMTNANWLNEIRDNLKEAYLATYYKAGKQADIIVAGYPELYYRDTSTAVAGKQQRKMLDDLVLKYCESKEESKDGKGGEIQKLIDEVNAEIRKENPDITRDKVHYVSVITEFENQGMDAWPYHEGWINGINLNGSEVNDQSNIGDKAYASAHPNKTGAEHYAKLVNEKIEELEKIKKDEREQNRLMSYVSGYVYNNTDGSQEYNKDTWTGLPGVTITVKEDVSGEGLRALDDKTTVTDSNGHYDIQLSAGKYEIEASHPTYGTQSISNVYVFDNDVTEAEWIVFNGKFSSTTLRIPGQDPIHSYNSNAEWAWTAYDHPNYDTSSGYDKHIIIDGNNIKMDGYLKAGYKDFLYVDDKNLSRKMFELDFQRDQTSEYDDDYNWHSMYGGGFLFNTSINEEANTISGYYILITVEGVELFKVNNMEFDTFRNSEEMGEQLATFDFDNKFDKHHIKIDVSSNKISLYDGDTIIIDNYELTEVYGNGFGPITSHIGHDCEQRSYFTFSSITMQTM